MTKRVYFSRSTQEFVGLDEPTIQRFCQAYPRVDVHQELKKMGLWLMSPKGSQRKGALSFILAWLSNAEPSLVPEVMDPGVDKRVQPYFDDYMKELWKDKENLLDFNQSPSS